MKESNYVKTLLTPEECKPLYEYCLTLPIKKKPEYDWLCPHSPSYYNDPIMKKLLLKFQPIMEELSGKKLDWTYCYFRIYGQFADMAAHTDRAACEFSISLNLGFIGGNWPMFIQTPDNITHKITLKIGEGLIYKGTECRHWRTMNANLSTQVQLFLHYVDVDGKNAWTKHDQVREGGEISLEVQRENRIIKVDLDAS